MLLHDLQQGERVRVLVVDDSAVFRRLVRGCLESDPLIEVVGTATNGLEGLQRISQLHPHIIVLDIEMPAMNGLEMLRQVRQLYPHLRVIMFSTLTERGAEITFEALALGADDYVAKGVNQGSLEVSRHRLQEEMVPKIKQFFRTPCNSSSATGMSIARPWQANRHASRALLHPRVVAIGCSTGGPAALGLILSELPPAFPLPVLIVQHMPPLFTKLLAGRLNASCPLQVEEARHGAPVEPGMVLIAPGDFHLKLGSRAGSPLVRLDQAPPLNFCRPAVDALFQSVTEVYGAAAIAVVLTGMGQDGLRGARELKGRGAYVLAQDESSSTVWGMPGAVVNAGLADRVLPLHQVVPELLRLSDVDYGG